MLHIQSTFSVFFIFILFFVVVVVVGTLAAMMFNTKENFFGRINMKMEIINFSLLTTNVAAVTSLANHQFLTSDDFVEKPMENDAAITASAGTHIEAQHVVEFLTI